MRELDNKAKRAAKDSELLEAFIVESEPFIIKSASKVSKRFITKQEDEYSVALIAFSEAVQKYDDQRGSFYSFAEGTIRSRLIDYFRTQGKHANETTLDWLQESHFVEYNDHQLALEIEALTPVLQSYGFSFMDLTESSPKAEKTKAVCAQAIVFLKNTPIIWQEVQRTKLLPLKIVASHLDLPQKILERHRKYIIAAAEILMGEYPYLADYLRFIKEHE